MASVSRTTIVLVRTVVAALVAVPVVSAHGNQVAADSQLSTDGTVLVETGFVVTDAWIVVHRGTNGSMGDPIGRTAIDANTVRSDIPVEIDDTAWDSWGEAQRVQVVLHDDDGDGRFEPGDDPPLTRGGSPIAESIVVGKADATAYVGAQGFHPHETSGTLTVRRVTSPTDGFLVVHNGSTMGTVVGHTELTPGTQENVTVDLNVTVLHDRGSQADFAPVLYRDDGDGQFDPASDSVVQAGDDPVGSTIGVRINTSALPATPTETEHHDDHDDHEHTESDDHDDHEHTDYDPG